MRIEQGWRAVEVAGPLGFLMVGVMAGHTVPLAETGISVFVVSTYDTDNVRVRSIAFTHAITVLRAAVHTVDAG